MRIISFSGIDGSGKGTQIKLLESHLKETKIKYKTIWARGSWTPGIELVKKIVRRDKGFSEIQKDAYRKEARTNPKKQKIIILLSILDLYWFFGLYYRFIALFNKVLICDRYVWDTVADFRVDFSNYDFEKWVLWKLLVKLIPKPNPSFILVISAEQSIKRGILKNEEHMDSLEVKMKKSEEYMKLIKDKKWSDVIDGNMDINKIHAVVKKELSYEN